MRVRISTGNEEVCSNTRGIPCYKKSSGWKGHKQKKKDGMKITSHVNYYLWVIMNILDVEYLVLTLVTFTSHKCKCKCAVTTNRHVV